MKEVKKMKETEKRDSVCNKNKSTAFSTLYGMSVNKCNKNNTAIHSNGPDKHRPGFTVELDLKMWC